MRFQPTQAERLLAHIRSKGGRGMSYLDLSFTGVSASGWRRLSPDEHPERYLRKGERLERFVKEVNGKPLVHFKIVRA